MNNELLKCDEEGVPYFVQNVEQSHTIQSVTITFFDNGKLIFDKYELIKRCFEWIENITKIQEISNEDWFQVLNNKEDIARDLWKFSRRLAGATV